MKKKILKLSMAFVVVAMAAISANIVANPNAHSSVLLENIEAMAAGEDISGTINCSGSGSVYCPLNRKSDYREVTYEQK